MNWLDEVKIKLKKKNLILFGKNSEYLQDLILLLQSQTHRVTTLWAFDFAEQSIAKLEEKYPQEQRPREALQAAKTWAEGIIKMPFAQRKILDCHAFAKDLQSKEDIAICHAVGQACGVVHAVGHAIGYPIYDLTSIIYKYGIEQCSAFVEKRKQEYIDKLFYWKEHLCDYKGNWASFIQ